MFPQFRWCWQFGETLVWTGQGYFFATLQYIRGAPSWFNLKPEDLQMQVGKLAEKYDVLVVVVTLEDGFGVPQVEFISGIKSCVSSGRKTSLRLSLRFCTSSWESPSSSRNTLTRPQRRYTKWCFIFGVSGIHRFARYCRRVKVCLPAGNTVLL